MSLASQMTADVAGVFLNASDFGETAKRVRPDRRHSSEVVCLPVWDQPDQTTENGRDERLRGSLHVAADTSYSTSDHWYINGNKYVCTSVGEAQYGMQWLRITRAKQDMQTGSREVV